MRPVAALMFARIDIPQKYYPVLARQPNVRTANRLKPDTAIRAKTKAGGDRTARSRVYTTDGAARYPGSM